MSDRAAPVAALKPAPAPSPRAPEAARIAPRASALLGGRRAGSSPPLDGAAHAAQRLYGNRAVGRLLDPQTVAHHAFAGAGGALPHLGAIQRSFGPYDVSTISAYTGTRARQANRVMGSEAMTRGEQVALGGSTPLHVAAHEAAHVLQHRAGLRIPGGVGGRRDTHEDFADRIADRVTSGRSATDLLDGALGPRARRPGPRRVDAPLQMYTRLDRKDTATVGDRIAKRGGTGTKVKIKDDFYTGESAEGLVASDVASMARDPIFEMAALRFEEGLASLAYNHPRTEAVCAAGARKVLAYFDAKHAKSLEKTQEIDRELQDMGIADPGWSGAVGKSARAVRAVLTSGSVNEQVAHVESFVRDILARDVMENEVDWRAFAETAGHDLTHLKAGYQNVAFTGDRYLIFDTASESATGMQWHTRAKAEDVRAKTKRPDKFHPSSVKALPKAPDVSDVSQAPLVAPKPKPVKGGEESVTVRDLDRLELGGGMGMGVKLGAGEKALQKLKNKDDKALAWVEGARVFALNELDGWVFAQRQLSLPLVAGTSSTAARIMQAFRFLGVGPMDDVRLAAIAAMLVGRHHSLVEVMEAAKRYGASPYTPGPAMYHELDPLTDSEIRAAGLEFPDEHVDPNKVRGGYSIAPDPEPKDEQIDEPQSGKGGLLGLLNRPKAPKQVIGDARRQEFDDVITRLTDPSRPRAFARTRASIQRDLGISNTFEGRNSAQARLLRAVDAYHAATEVPDQLVQLRKVRDEAVHWLGKHPAWLLGKATTTRKKFMTLRDEAQAVIDAHIADEEAAYLQDLRADRLFASSAHVGQAMHTLTANYGDDHQLADRYGLSLAELAAIKVYCGPAYKFINPALEGDRGVINQRLLGFVREIKLATNNQKSAKQRLLEAEEARRKLVSVSDPIEAAITEGNRHAVHAMRGLSKLPPFTGVVYAGGAVSKSEALRRFKTGEVQLRQSFASTSAQEYTASNFATSKNDKLEDAYKSIPENERDPQQAPFPFLLRYTSKTGRDIQALSVDPGEKEVLFAPGSKLKIVKGADSPEAEQKFGGGDLLWTYIDAEEVV